MRSPLRFNRAGRWRAHLYPGLLARHAKPRIGSVEFSA